MKQIHAITGYSDRSVGTWTSGIQHVTCFTFNMIIDTTVRFSNCCRSVQLCHQIKRFYLQVKKKYTQYQQGPGWSQNKDKIDCRQTDIYSMLLESLFRWQPWFSSQTHIFEDFCLFVWFVFFVCVCFGFLFLFVWFFFLGDNYLPYLQCILAQVSRRQKDDKVIN